MACLGARSIDTRFRMNTVANAVFLSYASQDADAARRICAALRAIGLDVWFDQSALRGGDAWDASIRRQIKECSLFVPIISANTQTREEGYFRLEWKLAVDRSHLMAEDKAFLLPVVIDATLDGSARVPEKFREVHWTHLPAGEAAADFAEQVHRLLSDGAVQPQVKSSRAEPAATATVPTPAVATPASESQSIAVLPFVNRSHSEEDEYFSDGLADELLNVLAKIRGLRVAARTSSFQFKGKNDDIASIGRKLNVTTVLEGSVRKSGNRMRISVQLVKVADGYHLWSETYDRTFDDIFAVQDDIAQSVVKELRTMLLGTPEDAPTVQEVTAQVAAASKGRATDPEAHRLFLQARYFEARSNRDDAIKSIDYFKQAVALDPAFALAWAELGGAYANQAGKGWAPLAEGVARAREAVAHALALEPDLGQAHAQMGWILMHHDWDWQGAETSMRRALELAPGDEYVVNVAGTLANTMGRTDEAISHFRNAIVQDPLRAAPYSNLGNALRWRGHLAEAEAQFRKVIELAPQRSGTHLNLGLLLLHQGRIDEARAEVTREPDEWFRLVLNAVIHDVEGDREKSDVALQELIDKYHAEGAYQVAQVYGARADVDRAFEWLDRAYDQRDPGVTEAKQDPEMRALHADPRWEKFLRKLKLAD